MTNLPIYDQFGNIAGQTDQMGFVYYDHYPAYFEVARAEMVREMGVPYRAFEEVHGIMMPVLGLNIRYRKPARYDDLLTIRSVIPAIPTTRIRFDHEVHNETGVLLLTAFVELAFIRRDSMRPTRTPQFFLDMLGV